MSHKTPKLPAAVGHLVMVDYIGAPLRLGTATKVGPDGRVLTYRPLRRKRPVEVSPYATVYVVTGADASALPADFPPEFWSLPHAREALRPYRAPSTPA